MTKEEFITKAKELAVDFWTMNLSNGTYEYHFKNLVDEYEGKQCNISEVAKPFYCALDYNHNAGRCKYQCRLCSLEDTCFTSNA